MPPRWPLSGSGGRGIAALPAAGAASLGPLTRIKPRALQSLRPGLCRCPATDGALPPRLSAHPSHLSVGTGARAAGQVDYLSLDVEGGEVAALRSVDWARVTVAALTVEDNARDTAGPSPAGRAVRELLGREGYRLAGALAQDDIFVRADSDRPV